MKKTLILISILTAFVASAQSIEINPNGGTNASAILDLKSTTKGFLLPRMTNAQMRDIPSPAQGLLVFCTNCGTTANGEYYFFKGTAWVILSSTTVSSFTSIGTVSDVAYSEGATVTSGGELKLAPANATKPGIITATDQTFGGVKTFSNGIIGNVTGNVIGNVTGNADAATKIASITNADIVQLTSTQTLTNKTLTSPTITGTGAIAGNFTGDLTGNVTGNAGTATKIASITNADIVQLTSTQTLTNKTLTSPTITGTGAIAGTFTGNLTGNVIGNVTGNVTGNAATVTTNANLTGDVTSIGNATTVVKINGTSLSGLPTGILKNTTATGVPTIATAGTDYQLPITLTTTGSGAATLSSNILNIPNVSYTLPTATSSTLGGVKIDGTSITMNPEGVVSVTPASIGAQVAGNYLTSSTGVTSLNGSTTGLTPASATSGAVTLGGILVGANGGTGVANTGKTITLGGNLTTSGAFTTALTTTANTAVTLPVTGTLATLAGTETLTNKTLTTPNLGTPTYVNLSNATGLPLTKGVTEILPVLNGGTGSSTKNFVDLTNAQTIEGAKTFRDGITANVNGHLSGTALTATTATNISGGAAGSIPYQTATGTTSLLAAGSSGQVLTSTGLGTLTWATASSSGVDLTTDQTIGGVKTFSSAPVLSSTTASKALFTDANKNIVSNEITGTGNVVMSNAPTLTGTLTVANQTLSGTLGLGTSSPNASAKLDVSSTTQGFLTPRMSASQRTAIISPATGLIVYQTDASAGFYYNAGTPEAPSWVILLNGASSVDASSKITGTVPIANGGTGTINGSITGTGALTFAAGGSNQNISITPSGSGSVGIGTSSPNTTAVLDVTSTTKGFLPPRMSTVERVAINNGRPAEGLVVYDLTLQKLFLFKGLEWVSMTDSNVPVFPDGSTSGDLMYWNSTDKKWANLAPGTEGQVLRISSGLPVWGAGTVSFTCGTNTVSDVDNNTYTTVLIGNQCWTKENLRVTRYTDGTEIPFDATGGSSGISSTWRNLTTGARTIYYNDNTGDLLSVYGYLYNWYAARGIISNGGTSTKNICPTGWHVPTENEWKDLETQLGDKYSAGQRMKLNNHPAFWEPNPYGGDNNNSSNFSALSGGIRYFDGSFSSFYRFALFWSASGMDNIAAYFRMLKHDSRFLENTYESGYSFSKQTGGSIRCLRD